VSPKPFKIDVSTERRALTDSPFAALSPAPATPALPAKPGLSPTQKYRVARTKAGGWPIRIEKRPGNKLATIIDRIEGDASALAAALKKHLATGGHGKGNTVELQGDHRDAVCRFLDNVL
jgi:translation initiation factor 1 (eIF-1/SUI1)